MKSLVSFLGGRLQATSDLTRRSINGCSTVCSFRITLEWFDGEELEEREKYESNWVEEEKTSGNRKLSKAHSSCRLFCSGLPLQS